MIAERRQSETEKKKNATGNGGGGGGTTGASGYAKALELRGGVITSAVEKVEAEVAMESRERRRRRNPELSPLAPPIRCI